MRGSVGTPTNFCGLSRRHGKSEPIHLPNPLGLSQAEKLAGISRKQKAAERRVRHDAALKIRLPIDKSGDGARTMPRRDRPGSHSTTREPIPHPEMERGIASEGPFPSNTLPSGQHQQYAHDRPE